ncbi:MAG: flagellar hook-associated protein FlgL [Candidatus Rifleibacteriota bacterium]
MRVTNQYIINSFINQINRNNSELSNTQIKVSSGKNFSRPSESPTASALSMLYKTEIVENKQFSANVDNANQWYQNIDASLTTVETAIQRVRELAVQGANDTLVQADRDAIAEEINEILLHLVDVGNTNVAGQYIFAGHDVDKKPFEYLTGLNSGANTNMVTFSLGDVREDINLNNPMNIIYGGDNKRITSEIDRGTIVEKSVTGHEIFFGSSVVTPTPGFTYTYPPLEKSLPLDALNSGKGVQQGMILITDQNLVQHKVDLSTAHTLDDVIGIINATRSFEAGIEEVPSDTAAALGLYRNAGQTSTLIGLSDPKMLSEFTNLTDLNGGLGVPEGYLNINTRDGRNHRVDLTGAVTVGDVVARINAIDGGASVQATFDMIHKRIDLSDITGGTGDFSVDSTRSQLFIKDVEPHVASDLGILNNVGAGNQIFSTYDEDMESEATPLSFLNGGKGVEPGYMNITGHDGVTTRVDLTSVGRPQDVIDAINLQTGGNQTASFDLASKRIVITDNTFGGDDFRIEEVFDNNPVAVKEVTTVTKNLGLLKSSQGNTIVGDSLIPGGLTLADPLSSLTPPPEVGFMVIRGADNQPVDVDLTGASTIGDVVNAINNTGKFTATWDTTANRFVVSDPNAVSGNYGITIEETSNTGRDLGFILNTSNHTNNVLTGSAIVVKALPTLTGSLDMNPAVTRETELKSLNSGRTFNSGVNLGYIRITDKAGHFKAIDLRGSETIGDILDKINDPANGLYIEARINKDQNGLEIIDKNHGATGKLEVIDIDSTSAFDLGIVGQTVDHNWVGKDIDPGMTSTTPISALRVNDGGVIMGKLYVQSGEFSGEIDLTGVKTVGELIDKFSNTDANFNIQAWISDDGRRINLTNTKGEPFIKVRDLAEGNPNVASSLGLGNSPSVFTTLMDLRDNLLRNDAKAISEENLKMIDEDLNRILKLHAEVGTKSNRVTATKEKQENISLNLKKMLSSVEDIDMAEAIVRMTELETAYQAALQTGARVMQTTLMEFLR